jgi:hypothetical protein
VTESKPAAKAAAAAWQSPPTPQWAMPLAEKLGEALRGIALHRNHIEMDMAWPSAERAFWDVMSLAAGDVYLGYDDRKNLITLITGRKRVTVKDALKAVTAGR